MAAVELFPGVISDPDLLGGEATIKDTRIPVSLIVGHLSSGMRLEELLDEYDLTQEQVRTALGYAKHLLEEKQPHATRP